MGGERHFAVTVDKADRSARAMTDRGETAAKLKRHSGAGPLELRGDNKFHAFIDKAPRVARLHRRQPLGKRCAAIELRVDDKLAVRIDVPRAPPYRHDGESVGESPGLLELRRDLDLAAAVDISGEAVLPDQEESAPLLARPGRFHPAASR